MLKVLTMWITTNWKIVKEMGIPDHLTCLLRNLYAGQEATVRTRHWTMDWFQIRKGVHQGCILSPCLSNLYAEFSSVQFSSAAQLCLTLCDPMDCSTPGLPVHHQLLEYTQTHVHWVGDAIQPSHPLLSPSPPALNLSTSLVSFLRNLYTGQEATVKTGHRRTNWFQIEKGVHQGCILSPCLFNFYAEYIMRNAGLEEAQAGIKIAGRNINNLRYANNTTLMAESEEELKSLLMKVKEGSEKVGLENEDYGIWSHHFMGNRWGNSGNSG